MVKHLTINFQEEIIIHKTPNYKASNPKSPNPKFIPYVFSPKLQSHHPAFYFLPAIKPGNETSGRRLH